MIARVRRFQPKSSCRRGSRPALALTIALLLLLGSAVPALAQDGTPSPAASPSALTPDQPPAAFASGPWHISVPAADRGRSIASLKLNATDNEWAALAIDVTNWSEKPQTLDLRDLQLDYLASPKPMRPRAADSEDVADLLNFKTALYDKEVTLKAGATLRVAAVYSIPRGARGLSLFVGTASLSVDGMVSLKTPFNKIADPVDPPALIDATVADALDGKTLQVTGSGLPDAIALADIDVPTGAECLAAESTAALQSLAGKAIQVEAAATSDPSLRHVWVTDADGNRLLLNQAMLAQGFAGLVADAAMPYVAWLAESQDAAKAARVGVWSDCTSLHGVKRSKATDNVALSLLGDSGRAVKFTVWAFWSPKIVSHPDGNAWAFFSATAKDGQDGDRRLYSSRFNPATGTWSDAVPMSGGRVQFGVAATIDSTGRVHVVFSDRAGDSGTSLSNLVYTSNSGNERWPDPVKIAPNGSAGDQLAPSLAIDGNDTLHVAWQDQRAFSIGDRTASSSNADLFSASKPMNGEWTAAIPVNEHIGGQSALWPHIVADGDRVVVVWSVYETTRGLEAAARIEWSRKGLEPDDTWASAQTLVAGRGEQFGGRLVDLAADPTGGVVVAFGRRNYDTFLFVRRLPAASTAWGSDILVTFGQSGAFPTLSVSQFGTVFVAFVTGSETPFEVGIVAIAGGSNEPGEEVALTTGIKGSQARATLCTDASGQPWLIVFNESTSTEGRDPNGIRILRAPSVPAVTP